MKKGNGSWRHEPWQNGQINSRIGKQDLSISIWKVVSGQVK
jgi:hypothetical protein